MSHIYDIEIKVNHLDDCELVVTLTYIYMAGILGVHIFFALFLS